jgi:Uma2 family endonuclease
MTTAVSHSPFVSPEEYLACEMSLEGRHEYLNGVVYAMAGGTQRHNDIVGNIYAPLHAQLRSRACRPYGSDMLLKVEHEGDLRFYYPDVSVICHPAGPDARVQTEPSVIFEVISESTSRTDTGEKRMAYLTIASLEAYVLVNSSEREVTVWRRNTGGWTPEVHTSSEAVLEFTSTGCRLTVGAIYETTGL